MDTTRTKEHTVNCHTCKTPTLVTNSRKHSGTTVRRRACPVCHETVTTIEAIADPDQYPIQPGTHHRGTARPKTPAITTPPPIRDGLKAPNRYTQLLKRRNGDADDAVVFGKPIKETRVSGRVIDRRRGEPLIVTDAAEGDDS